MAKKVDALARETCRRRPTAAPRRPLRLSVFGGNRARARPRSRSPWMGEARPFSRFGQCSKLAMRLLTSGCLSSNLPSVGFLLLDHLCNLPQAQPVYVQRVHTST